MTIEWIPSPNFNRRPPGTTIDTIVVHSTVGSWQATVNTFQNPASAVSSHYLIDKSGRTARLVEDASRAWHAGDSFHPDGRPGVNDFSIGIELVNRNDGKDPYPPAQTDALVALCRDLVRRHPIRSLLGHSDVAGHRGKSDPRGLDLERVRAWVFATDERREVTNRIRQHLVEVTMLLNELEELLSG